MTPYLGFNSAGAEMRAASAVDIALWDLAGKRHGIPLTRRWAAACATEIRAYNTCAGYAYNTGGVGRRAIGAGRTRLPVPTTTRSPSCATPARWPRACCPKATRAMKIWPFDIYAAATGGQHDHACRPQGRARAVPQDPRGGRRPDRGDVRAAQPLVAAMRRSGSAARSRTSASSGPRIRSARWATPGPWPTCAARPARRSAAARRWAGPSRFASCSRGRARRRDARPRLVRRADRRPQDRGAGRSLRQAAGAARLHRAGHADGRACTWRCMRRRRSSRRWCARRLATWYRELVTDLPSIRNGMALAPTAPGLGTRLQPQVYARDDARIRLSGAPRSG